MSVVISFSELFLDHNLLEVKCHASPQVKNLNKAISYVHLSYFLEKTNI